MVWKLSLLLSFRKCLRMNWKDVWFSVLKQRTSWSEYTIFLSSCLGMWWFLCIVWNICWKRLSEELRPAISHRQFFFFLFVFCFFFVLFLFVCLFFVVLFHVSVWENGDKAVWHRQTLLSWSTSGTNEDLSVKWCMFVRSSGPDLLFYLVKENLRLKISHKLFSWLCTCIPALSMDAIKFIILYH